MDLYYGAPRLKQNKYIRNITNSKYNDSAGPIYNKHGILPLQKLYELEMSKFMYLHNKGLLPPPLMTLFMPNTNIHQHNTRHRNDPHINTRRTQSLSRSFIHSAPNI